MARRGDGRAMTTFGDDLQAFILGTNYCGGLDAAVESDRVWMTCTCGAVISRTLEPAHRQ